MTLLKRAEDIGLELAARLATRTIAQGAETDLGMSVLRGRRAVDDDMVPCVALIEGSDDVTENDSRKTLDTQIVQHYVALAYVACDPQHPNDAAHKAIRDMKRAVFTTDGQPDRTLGGRVRRVKYHGRDIGPRADGAGLVVASIEVSVEFVEDLASP